MSGFWSGGSGVTGWIDSFRDFDAVRAYVDSKNMFERKRGMTGNTPNTTWADVISFYSSFKVATQKGFGIGKYTQYSEYTQYIPGMTDDKKRQLKAALSAWDRYTPFTVAQQKYGMIGAAGFLTNVNNLEAIYPDNQRFWTAGLKYAILRSSLGAVPGKWEIANEAITEAAHELPSAIAAALDRVTPSLPSVQPYADLLKWTAVGSGLFMLYWYVLKPKKKTSGG